MFYGNGSEGTGSFGASETSHPSNVFNSFIPLQSSVDESCRTSHGNLFGEIISTPGFLKAAEGDYRLRGSSPLVNSGGAAEEWMGSGVLPEKGGVGDLGDGTWTADATATFTIRGVEYSVGANVAFNDVHPRLYGLPDMGCFEYFPESGLWIIFR